MIKFTSSSYQDCGPLFWKMSVMSKEYVDGDKQTGERL